MGTMIKRTEPRESTPAQWEPLRLMRDMVGWDPFAEMLPESTGEMAFFTPRFEVKETRKAYVFKADLPGIEEENLDITLTGQRLTISGKREAEKREEHDTYYAYERSYGSFSRSFTLPAGADVDHPDAELKHGVLTVTIAKKPEHQPRKVTLKSLSEKVKEAIGGKSKGHA